MLRLSCCCILFLILCSASVAAHTISGLVVDESDEALPGVIVTANGSDGEQIDYAITNEKGAFSISLQDNIKSVSVEAGMLGYKTETRTVTLPSDKKLTFKLQPEAIKLKEVNVSVKPIRDQGDTLIYDVAAFKSAADRSIEDVIKRLPGVRVSDNGQIRYQGEPINKFYIEGLDMLQGNYTLATRNISANDIATVNVYENHQPTRVLEGVEHSDKAALDLKLKKKSMLRPVGNVRAGGGYGSGSQYDWIGETNMLLVSPKVQSFIVAKGNNAGTSYAEENVDFNDRVIDMPPIASLIFDENMFSKPRLARRRYDYNRSALASANVLTKFSSDRTFSLNVTYNHDRSDVYGENTAYYLSGRTDPITVETRSGSLSRSNKLRARATYQDNSKSAFVLDQLSFTGSFTDNDYAVHGTNNVNQSLDLENFALSNVLQLIFKRGNRVWQIGSSLHMANTPWGGIEALSPDSEEPYLHQSTHGRVFYNREHTSMEWLVGSHVSLGAILDFKIKYDSFASVLAEDQSTGRNDVSGYKATTEFTPFFVWQNYELKWRTEVPIRLFDLAYDDRVADSRYTRHRPYPGISSTLSYSFPFHMKFTAGASYRQDIGDISNFITVPVYRSYRDISAQGSGLLGETSTASINSALSYRNSLHDVFGSVSFTHNWRTSNSTAVSDVSPEQTATSFADSKSRSRNMILTVSTSKRIRPINTTVTLNTSWNTSHNTFIRGDRLIGSGLSYLSVDGSVRGTLFSDRLALGFVGSFTHTTQKIDIGEAPPAIDDMSARIEISVFPIKQIEIFSHVTYNRTQLTEDKYLNPVFVDGGARYRSGRWEVELRLNNLTDRRTYSYQIFYNLDRIAYTYRLRPAEAIATIRMTF